MQKYNFTKQELEIKYKELKTIKAVSLFYNIPQSSMQFQFKKFNIVPKKTSIYTFPKWLIKHELVHRFMRGYFDGDGSVYIDKENQLGFNVVGNNGFLHDYKSILEKNCSVNVNKIYKDRSVYKIKYCGNNTVKSIYNFLYSDANIFLDRKKDVFYGGFCEKVC